MWKKETVQLQVQATSNHFRLGCYKPADIYIYISCDWVDHMSNFASTLCLSPFVGPEARLLQLVAVHKDVVKDVSRTGANVPAKHLRSRSSDRGRESNARHDSYIECFDVGRTGFLIVVANQLYMFSHVFPTLVLQYDKKACVETSHTHMLWLTMGCRGWGSGNHFWNQHPSRPSTALHRLMHCCGWGVGFQCGWLWDSLPARNSDPITLEELHEGPPMARSWFTDVYDKPQHGYVRYVYIYICIRTQYIHQSYFHPNYLSGPFL